MKIKYNMSDNYFKYYDEANGVISKKKKILKNKKVKITPYLKNVFILMFICFIVSIILLGIVNKLDLVYSKNILLGYIVFLVIYFIFIIISYNISYRSKFNSKSGILEITKKGLIDRSDNGTTLDFSYDNLELIVITKNLIVFCLPNPLMIFIPNKKKKDIVNNISKYSKVLIVDKSGD